MIRLLLRHLACLLGIHAAGLLMLSIMRLALYVAGHHFLAAESAGHIALQAQAFLRGVWFDNVVGCYILILPLAFTVLCHLAGKSRAALAPSLLWMRVMWLVAIGVSASDIPYFLYFFKNINSSIWNWAEYGTTTIGMLVGEDDYYPPMIGFLLVAGTFIWLTMRLRRHFFPKGRQAQGKGLTPFLDSLARKSLYFPRFYSAGNHTNHGIFSTLYSFPALMFRNLMKGSNIPHYQGLPSVLQANGYRTLFFMTHESQYDNMNAFLRTNGYDEIYSQENYPKREVVNSFGVPDHYLYRHALGRMARQKEPFMATLLSISNHPPYIIPEWFHPNADEEDEQIVEYADDALRLFFKQAEAQPWYEHTVFVLLGDHGKLTGTSENEMPQCLNHIPLIIHAPGLVAEEVQSWCMQMDVQPTLLSMLGITAHQENFGQNILQHPRSMALYTADNVIGARTDGHLYVYEPATHTEWLYRTDADGASKTVEQPDSTFLQMKEALFSTLQTAQEEIKKHE